MISPMFWNLCKSSWRKGLHLYVLGVLVLLSSAQDEGLSSSMIPNESYKCGQLFRGHSLGAGKDAGNFSRLGKSTSPLDCVDMCCNAGVSCKTALYVGALKACYKVQCESVEGCKPVSKDSNYTMSVFHRSIEGQREAKSHKRHPSCHHYRGQECTKYLDMKRLIYLDMYPPKSIETRLKNVLETFRKYMSENCRTFAMHAICHNAFPYCSDRKKTSAIRLCREDCEQLYDGVCRTEFMGSSSKEAVILPDCTMLPVKGSAAAVGCISLNIPDSLRVAETGPLELTANITDTTTTTKDGPSASNPQSNSDSKHEQDDQLDLSKSKMDTPDQSSTEKTSNEDTNGPTLAPNVNEKSTLSNNPILDDNTHKTAGVKDDLADDENIIEGESNDKSVNSRNGNNLGANSEDGDLGTPKRSDIPEKTESKTETVDNGGEVKLGHDQLAERPLTITNQSANVENAPSTDKLTGLGLQESMGLLDPAGQVSHADTGAPTASTLMPVTSPAMPTASTSMPTASPTMGSDDDVEDDGEHSNHANPTTRRERHTVPTSSAPADSPGKNSSVQNHATIVNITGHGKETNLAQTDNPAPTHQPTTVDVSVNKSSAVTTPKPHPSTGTTRKPTIHPTKAPPTLLVSAGDNKVLTLPINTIELYASAFPKETADNHYTYHWQQISAPQDSHGYMEGKDTSRVILSKLSHIGTYQFRVTVTGANRAFGVAHVNVTVKPVPRVNKPPRADISPKEQTITLPTNEVVLDGSKSTDDDKIAKYKWEEVKGPLNDKNKMISSGIDSPVLQLKSLVPGIYTFKLTVVDSDGETDATTATVTVNDEKDYPPVARAGNDVVLTLPINHVTLYGNGSTDDKGIVSYEWSKAPSSPAVGDMQGTNSQRLKVSNMVVGDYTFVLKVTDTGGQSATSRVTVVVQPEKNTAPVAKAGSDKDLVFPDDTTTLDSKGSYDDQKIVKYHWEQVSGPTQAEITGADERVVTVKKLTEGHFVFKLTVTDDKGLTGSDTVAVKVKKDVNQPPEAHAGPDVVVHLPNRAAELDGSKSSDDHGIAEYLWTRDPKSPAAGDVINSSNHQAILRLSNLVEGMYKFKLTVSDAKGLKSSDEALLTVKEDENSAHLVELFLDVDITKFTEENKGQLIRKLAVILDVQDDDIVVEHLKEAGTGHSMMVMFYVKGGSMAKDGQAVAETLKEKIENEEGFFEFRMLKVEPYICRNNCSFHGYCDRSTKLCVCESFWMQDIFKASFGIRESNCDWSILYVTVIIFGIIMGIGGIIWGICYCMGRRRLRTRRRHRYAIIDEDDDDKTESMEMLPKGKYSSLTLSDSYDDDSDEETTLFEAKKRVMNGGVNGGIKKHTF